MKRKYSFILDNNEKVNRILSSKELLKINPSLVVIDDCDNEVYRCDNIQTLYLYPLTIVDYIENINSKNILFVNIVKVDCNIDYIKLFENNKFKSIKAVEFLIDESLEQSQCDKICNLLEYFSLKNIQVSFNVKKISPLFHRFIPYMKKISYFKLYLSNMCSKTDYICFLDMIKLINDNTSGDPLIHVKTYLNIAQINCYEHMIDDFSKVGVDIFQVSKELIPLNVENISIDKKMQMVIRNLEQKYNSYDKCKFISVRDISTLYYPRFELDERNSRMCYASMMKPYLYLDRLLPCKVAKIFSNMDDWQLDYNDDVKYNFVLNKCGVSCSDCASIFENDLLSDVEQISKNRHVNIFLKKV